MTRAYNTATTQQNSGGAVAGVTAGKNAIINGGFDIWQRGTSSTSSTNTAIYSAADRWQHYSGATTNYTTSRQSSGLTGFQYCARVARNASSTATNLNWFTHTIETAESLKFAGQTVTLSFYARAGANFSPTSSTVNVKLNWGTGTDQNTLNGFTGGGETISSSFAPTTTWTRYTFTGTVDSTSTELGIRLTHTPTGTAGAADYYEITGVQLEVGSVATPFSRAGGTIAGELAACQRYFFKVGGEIAGQHTIRQGGYYDANYIGFYCPYPVPMRTAPSITAYGNPQVYQSGTAYSGFTWNNTIAGNPSTQNQYIVGTKTSHGLTVNLSCDLYCATTSDYIGVSAEL